MSRAKGPWRGGTSVGEKGGDPNEPRLTTSAMIASLASDGQRTSPAPFGRALLDLVAIAKLNEVQQYCSMTNHVWDGYWVLSNRHAFQRLPKDIQEIVIREFTRSGQDERADIAQLTDTLRQDLSAKGMKFIDPEREAFRAKLKATSFYKDWRAKFGDEGWKLLENVSG